jgi:transcriptional regulator with XRE-family HTH domain
MLTGQQRTDISRLHNGPVSTPVINRVRLLIEHLQREGRTQEDIASIFGRSQGWVSQVVAGTIREVKSEPTRTAIAKLRLSPSFFTGTGPVEDYLGTRTERDEDLSPYAEVEAYLSEENAAERPPVSEDHAREIRAVRYSGEVTVGMAASFHRELIARDRGKAVAGGAIISPVELPPGKRRIDSGKPRR